MITVSRTDDSIVVEGHANYAPMGQDIVCAAVSVLFITLVNSLLGVSGDEVIATVYKDNDKKEVVFEHLSEGGNLLVDAFFMGIKGIAKEYPDYVCVVENPHGQHEST